MCIAKIQRSFQEVMHFIKGLIDNVNKDINKQKGTIEIVHQINHKYCWKTGVKQQSLK